MPALVPFDHNTLVEVDPPRFSDVAEICAAGVGQE
jgi:hypothetical protein